MEQQYTFDLTRIFLGEHPPLYLVEVALRTLVTYGYLFLLMRLAGKRGMAQMSLFDWLLVIGLGSAVGDPMFYEDVPVLHCLLVITVVVGLEQAVNRAGDRWPRFGRAIDGVPLRIVSDGKLDRDNLGAERISRDEVFAALRVHGVQQLGEVERAYVEPSGRVSVLRRPQPLPGRSVLPWDDATSQRPLADEEVTGQTQDFCCFECGAVQTRAAGEALGACSECQARRWLTPVFVPTRSVSADA
jgi:uncharacterized membrane protein YcaP (DUF421 family)